LKERKILLYDVTQYLMFYPIKAPAAGVSVGLALDETDEESYGLLLDITGTEDHFGLMDFKIAGTENDVTALQLDVKQPLSLTIVAQALELANSGRRAILKEMEVQTRASTNGVISNLLARPNFKDSAPRVEVVRFDPMRKRDLLGPGGVVIRQMEDRFNVSLDLTQEGQCLLFGEDQETVKAAKAAVMDLVADVVVGGIYEGTVIEIRDFGAIIELLRNKEGLCHVSELAEIEEIKSHPNGTMGLVNDMLYVGQLLEVRCTAVDPVQGTIRLQPASKRQVKDP
jgi:polyribonucleotide nucleotidyltransferase